MRVLIVGARGMLGAELLEAFAPRHDTAGLDLPDIDITDEASSLELVRAAAPDLVVNAAAYTRVDECETHPGAAFRVNGEGAGHLARAAAEAGAALVHFSTDYVFDGEKADPYVEEDVPNPRSVYGRSKLLGETLVRERCPEHLLLRISWLFGPHGKNFIRTILDAARRGKPLRVVDDQTGSPTCARDAAARTVEMAEAGCRGVYHLTNRGSCSWYELARRSVEWAGLTGVSLTPVPASEFPSLAPRPARSTLANARLLREGFPPLRPWQEAAREYVENHLKK